MSAALAPAALLAHDVGVSASRARRRFTTAYKLKIITAADACTKPGEGAALLRREGLYSSHLATWRAAHRRGELTGPAPRNRAQTSRSQCEAHRGTGTPAREGNRAR